MVNSGSSLLGLPTPQDRAQIPGVLCRIECFGGIQSVRGDMLTGPHWGAGVLLGAWSPGALWPGVQPPRGRMLPPHLGSYYSQDQKSLVLQSFRGPPFLLFSFLSPLPQHPPHIELRISGSRSQEGWLSTGSLLPA